MRRPGGTGNERVWRQRIAGCGVVGSVAALSVFLALPCDLPPSDLRFWIVLGLAVVMVIFAVLMLE